MKPPPPSLPPMPRIQPRPLSPRGSPLCCPHGCSLAIVALHSPPPTSPISLTSLTLPVRPRVLHVSSSPAGLPPALVRVPPLWTRALCRLQGHLLECARATTPNRGYRVRTSASATALRIVLRSHTATLSRWAREVRGRGRSGAMDQRCPVDFGAEGLALHVASLEHAQARGPHYRHRWRATVPPQASAAARL